MTNTSYTSSFFRWMYFIVILFFSFIISTKLDQHLHTVGPFGKRHVGKQNTKFGFLQSTNKYSVVNKYTNQPTCNGNIIF